MDRTISLKVDVHSKKCASKVIKAISKVPEIRDFSMSLKEQKLTLIGDFCVQGIIDLIAKKTGACAQVLIEVKKEHAQAPNKSPNRYPTIINCHHWNEDPREEACHIM